ncbi:MAG: serpin family protein [Candidatus Sericytochromatia bacterium]|nr:serpin family protein [Candidatus Sericytochromatia bacterium]
MSGHVYKGMALVVWLSLVACQIIPTTKTNPSLSPSPVNENKQTSHATPSPQMPSPIATSRLNSLTDTELQSLKNSQLLDGYNHLAFELLHILSKDLPKDQNLVFSPLSIASLLTVLYLGSSGETRQTLGKVLQIEGMSNEEVSQAYALLKRSLQSEEAFETGIFHSIWIQKNQAFTDEFVPQATDLYDVQFETGSMDFETENRINNWIREKTHNQISAILPQNTLQPKSQFILLNTLYLRANWLYTFSPSLTYHDTFTTALNEQKQALFLHKNPRKAPFDEGKEIYFSEQLDVKAINERLRQLDLLIALPQAKSALEWAKTLTYGEWYSLKMAIRKGSLIEEIAFPRWKQEQAHDLKTLMAPLGLDKILTSPDFSPLMKMVKQPDQMLHKAKVSLNEQGIDGPLVSSGQSLGGEITPRIRFVADRPFFYSISSYTNAILYMGIVNDPSKP